MTKFAINIDKDVPPGAYDVRIVCKNGVSNPRRFIVSDLNEIIEKEPNNDVEQAQPVGFGSAINGAIPNGTDVDYYRFGGKKGQRFLIACLTASIDSRLDPEIRVIGPAGKVVGYDRAMPGQDGLLDLTLPEDGDYLIRINKFTYTTTNAEYFYRLHLTSAPYIDAVFPPMIEPGKTADVTLLGRNLPGGKIDPSAVMNGQPLERLTVKITAPADADSLNYSGVLHPLLATLDGFEYRLHGPTGLSNPVLLTYAKAPVILENDDNDTLAKAQAVPLPSEIAGRVDKKRDRDWYAFDAKKGDVLTIELLSHRLGASTDLYFKLTDAAGKQEFTLQDDNTETLSPRFFTGHSRDPAPYRFSAPADGKYHLLIASHLADSLADPTHIYRLRITPEMPDFRLFVMPPEEARPDTCLLLQGGTYHYTVFAQRMDGFQAPIELSIDGLPEGVTCVPQVIAGSMKSTQLVLSADENAPAFTGSVKVTGSAVVKGQKIMRQARPATITWGVPNQPNIPTATRLDRDLMLAVREKAAAKLIAEKENVTVAHGDKVEIPLKLTRLLPEFKGNFQIQTTPGELPAGMTFGNLNFTPGKDALKAVLNVAGSVPPGTYNLAFRGFGPIPPSASAKPVNTILISTPVRLVVVPKQVATLSVDNANPTVKAGGETAVTVRVARQYDYADAFAVELVLPKDAKGLSADKITIEPGKNEAKLLVHAAPDATPANVQNLTLRAAAVVNGDLTLNHELKINVTIAK